MFRVNPVNPAEIAEILAKLFTTKFDGKNRGRYQLSRAQLQDLSGRQILYDSLIEEITVVALHLGYCLVNLGDFFIVLKKTDIDNSRKISQSIIDDCIVVVEDDVVGRITVKDVKKNMKDIDRFIPD